MREFLDEDDSPDEENLRIAELEMKLGMDKIKGSKGVDDGLDGTPQDLPN